MAAEDRHLNIGSIVFDGIDQIDLTGPFEVLSLLPDSTHRIYARSKDPIRSHKGLRILPDATIDEAPQLDVLHVPGGPGQEEVMNDAALLAWLRHQAGGARVFSVCTGALLLGAAGLLVGRRATTHWASFHLLHYYGAIPVDQRVVMDGDWIFAAGVTAGIDGALRLAAELRGDEAAQVIQLECAYAPEPPFDAGTPDRAPRIVLDTARASSAMLIARREVTAKRFAASLKLGTTAGVV